MAEGCDGGVLNLVIVLALCGASPAALPDEPICVTDEVRVTLELEWELRDVELECDARDPLAPLLDGIALQLSGSRTLVWLDERLAVDEEGASTAYRRTWERLDGEDRLRVDSSFGTFDVGTELVSPLTGCAHVARRTADGWEAELVAGTPPDEDPGAFDGLTWEVDLEELLPRRRFVYLSGGTCQRLLRPVGWPPWRGTTQHPTLLESTFLTASPLARPRLDDPRFVVRRHSEGDTDEPLHVEVEVRETLDLSRNLGDLDHWLDASRARLSLEADGRGPLQWSAERAGPEHLDLEFDLDLSVDLGRVRIVAEGTLRQVQRWERATEREGSSGAGRLR